MIKFFEISSLICSLLTVFQNLFYSILIVIWTFFWKMNFEVDVEHPSKGLNVWIYVFYFLSPAAMFYIQPELSAPKDMIRNNQRKYWFKGHRN